MKKSIFLLFALLSLGLTNMQAQSDIVINEIMQYMSQGEKTGYEVALVDAEPKDVEVSWMKFMKKNKAKVIKTKKSVEILADNANFPNVSANTIDIYAIATKAPYGTKLSVFVDLGGTFISSQDHEVAYGAFEGELREFALGEAVRVVEEELKNQEKVLKELNKELANFIKEKDGYLQEIEKAKALIAQRETDIVNNEQAQETKRAQINIQEEIIKTIERKRSELNY